MITDLTELKIADLVTNHKAALLSIDQGNWMQ